MKLVPARISKAIRRTMRLSKVGVKSLAAWIGADSWMHEMHENSINRKHKMINNYITHNDAFYFTLNDVSIRVSQIKLQLLWVACGIVLSGYLKSLSIWTA